MDRSHSPALLALALLLGVSTACARSPVPEASPPPAPPATRQAPAPTSQMTLGQLQERLLGYADALKKPSDVSPEAFASMLGVDLVPFEPGAVGGEAKRQVLADGYVFYADYSSLSSPASFPLREVLFFQPGGKSVTDDPNAPCLWEEDKAAKALEAIGYRGGGEGPFQRGRMHQFWRPIGDGKQGFDTSLLTYTTGTTTCVYGVRFWGGDA